MARSSLANSFSNLNLSRRQIALFQKIIINGNQMAEILDSFDQQLSLKQDACLEAHFIRTSALSKRWPSLMVELAKMLV